jgi:hypothetical protein
MSEPLQDAVPSPAPEAPRTRRARRWTDTAALLLLGVSLAAVLATASPALLRAAGIIVPVDDTVPHEEGRLKLPTPPPGAPGNPILKPGDEDDEDDEPHLTQLERDYPEGLWPGRKSAEDRARERAIFGAPPDSAAGSKTALALGPLKLFEDPVPGAGVVALIAKGTSVQIVREVGAWALIKYRGSGTPITGWVQKSEISVR